MASVSWDYPKDRMLALQRQAQAASVATPVLQTQVAAAQGFAANVAFDPLAAGPASTAAQPADPTAVQNRQDQKDAFQKAGATETRNSGNLTLPASPYQVTAGTVLAGALVTGIKFLQQGDFTMTTRKLRLGPLPKTESTKLTFACPASLKADLDRYAAPPKPS